MIEEVLPGITLAHAPAEAFLPTLEAGSVHAVVTSPPYWKKRRYSGDPGELGQEATPEAFVARLVAILRPLRRPCAGTGCCCSTSGTATTTSTAAGHGP